MNLKKVKAIIEFYKNRSYAVERLFDKNKE